MIWIKFQHSYFENHYGRTTIKGQLISLYGCDRLTMHRHTTKITSCCQSLFYHYDLGFSHPHLYHQRWQRPEILVV